MPIRFSAAMVENSANPEGAERFVAFLTSPAGQAIVQDHHFLPSPILVGGDLSAVPRSIQPAIQGDFH